MNLRTGPGTEYSMVRVLSAGDEIDVVAETSNGWYRTVKGNYVKASLCTSEKPAEPEPQNEGGGGGGLEYRTDLRHRRQSRSVACDIRSH